MLCGHCGDVSTTADAAPVQHYMRGHPIGGACQGCGKPFTVQRKPESNLVIANTAPNRHMKRAMAKR